MKVRDSEPYKRALAKQVALRERLTFLFDSLQLDAMAYPTLRQRPAIVGEPQIGSGCALAAQSGLPAISLQAGFTYDGLPIGLELMGRPMSDTRLVAFAYAFEQSGSRRRPPPTTPPLVGGRAPAPVSFMASATAPAMTVRSRFTFDRTRNRLDYDLQVTGTGNDVNAVVLRRVDAVRTRVIHRLSGPGVTAAKGSITLTSLDARALAEGRIALSLFAQQGKPGIGDARLELPK
jgi:amidase